MNPKLNRLLKMAMLCAISIVFVALIRLPIFPQAPYLVYDPADIPLLIGAFLYGPVAGIMMTLVTSGIQALFFSADGWVGFFDACDRIGHAGDRGRPHLPYQKDEGDRRDRAADRRCGHDGHHDSLQFDIYRKLLQHAL